MEEKVLIKVTHLGDYLAGVIIWGIASVVVAIWGISGCGFGGIFFALAPLAPFIRELVCYLTKHVTVTNKYFRAKWGVAGKTFQFPINTVQSYALVGSRALIVNGITFKHLPKAAKVLEAIEEAKRMEN